MIEAVSHSQDPLPQRTTFSGECFGGVSFSKHFEECLTKEEVDLFISIRSGLPLERRLFLTELSAEEYMEAGTRLFLSRNGRGGYGISNEGELLSVFCIPGARLGTLIVADAVKQGASFLYCFDRNDRLPQLYRPFGFREVERYAFSSELAPELWLPELGRPDVVKMIRKGQCHE